MYLVLFLCLNPAVRAKCDGGHVVRSCSAVSGLFFEKGHRYPIWCSQPAQLQERGCGAFLLSYPFPSPLAPPPSPLFRGDARTPRRRKLRCFFASPAYRVQALCTTPSSSSLLLLCSRAARHARGTTAATGLEEDPASETRRRQDVVEFGNAPSACRTWHRPNCLALGVVRSSTLAVVAVARSVLGPTARVLFLPSSEAQGSPAWSARRAIAESAALSATVSDPSLSLGPASRRQGLLCHVFSSHFRYRPFSHDRVDPVRRSLTMEQWGRVCATTA